MSLYALVAFSFINLFAISFGDMYFLFSSYFTQILSAVFAEVAVEENVPGAVWIGIVLGVIVLVPYLLAAIFSKKRVGWMIAALAFFAVDSLLFFYDMILGLASGYFGNIVDLVFHVWALIDLIMGVKYGVQVKKNPPAPVPEEIAPATDTPSDDDPTMNF